MINEERLAVIATGAVTVSQDEIKEMAQLLRSRFIGERGRTHWEGCWREHYQCAMRKIDEGLKTKEDEDRALLDLINAIEAVEDGEHPKPHGWARIMAAMGWVDKLRFTRLDG